MGTRRSKMEPYLRIAITNLGAYNRGKLIYEWLDLPCSEECLAETIQGVLEYDPECCANGDEEIFISDTETNLEYSVGEYENISKLNTWMDELEDACGRSTYIDEVNAVLRACDGDMEYAIRVLDHGSYDCIEASSEEELGRALVENGNYGRIPDSLEYYIDYEAIGRDEDANANGGLYADLGYFINLTN